MSKQCGFNSNRGSIMDRVSHIPYTMDAIEYYQRVKEQSKLFNVGGFLLEQLLTLVFFMLAPLFNYLSNHVDLERYGHHFMDRVELNGKQVVLVCQSSSRVLKSPLDTTIEWLDKVNGDRVQEDLCDRSKGKELPRPIIAKVSYVLRHSSVIVVGRLYEYALNSTIVVGTRILVLVLAVLQMILGPENYKRLVQLHQLDTLNNVMVQYSWILRIQYQIFRAQISQYVMPHVRHVQSILEANLVFAISMLGNAIDFVGHRLMQADLAQLSSIVRRYVGDLNSPYDLWYSFVALLQGFDSPLSKMRMVIQVVYLRVLEVIRTANEVILGLVISMMNYSGGIGVVTAFSCDNNALYENKVK